MGNKKGAIQELNRTKEVVQYITCGPIGLNIIAVPICFCFGAGILQESRLFEDLSIIGPVPVK